MPIKLVVFDMAGTTVADESGVMDTFKSSLAKYGYDVPLHEIAPLMGYEKKLAIRTMLERHEADPNKSTDKLVSAIHQYFVDTLVNHYRNATDLEALPNAEETLLYLREQGIKVGLNTGFSRIIADSIINNLKWRERGLFDYMICSDEVPAGRPDPAMIHYIMKEAGVTNPAEVAKVGDTEVDINEGKNVGCKYIIAVTTGAFTREQLETYQPTHIIDNIADVVAIVTEKSDAIA
ncbi:HAD-IA family hydrolase [Mucilaginibacter achroorhodeus]|uniref:HAD-IA family hydrolase n=1 Tax=Mucilaginibacter achroorhodeus TaxID=2599294 RepID=A0A563U255_9SPHI|nr:MULTISPECIES: HAD-IA family hydrolase [Mucilaginibacter]QXV67529.1 HAD-IA family hydrolase [Mucilaginibacter sp. 21P]TWR25402.1 HAD-IA family hydrolase [Mucilaginibacter achroorhodeus]